MRGIFVQGFRKCGALTSALNGCARKREKAFPLPPVKRQRLLGPILPQPTLGVFESGEEKFSEEEEEEEAVDEGVQFDHRAGVGNEKLTLAGPNHVDVPRASQGGEKYPSVVYEGDVATVELGVGQMVILDGCAVVQVVEGQAAMLGYSFPRGIDVLVCSSSELAEVITIEARHGLRKGTGPGETGVEDATTTERSEASKSLQETLGCQLRFVSHNLGQEVLASRAGSGGGLSFRLEFVGSLGSSSLGKKRGRQYSEQQNQDQPGSPDCNVPCSDDHELNLDSEARHSDSVEDGDERDAQLFVPAEDVELARSTDNVKKRKVCGQNMDSVKRQRVVEMLDSYSSATSMPHDWKEAVETITLGSGVPVVALAVQRMLESLRLLGS